MSEGYENLNEQPGLMRRGVDKVKDMAEGLVDGTKYVGEITADTFRGMRQDMARVVEVGRESSQKVGNAMDSPLTDKAPKHV